MRAIRSNSLWAISLVAVVILVLGTGCKEDKNPCEENVKQTLSLSPGRDSNHFILAVENLELLDDPTIEWDDIELQATVSGKLGLTETLSLSFNGFKFNRKDGRRALEDLKFFKKDNTSTASFKLHKLHLNGAEPFQSVLSRIKKNKGVLEIKFSGRKLKVLDAKVTFQGKSHKKCPRPTPGTTPTPLPTPPPQAPETTLNSVDPSKSPTSSTSIAFTFSSDTEGNSFWCSLDNSPAELCTSPKTYSNLGNGAHTFAVYAQSPRGLVDSTPATYSWTVDTLPPSVTITNAAELPTLTNSREIQFNIESSKPGSTFSCSLDGGGAIPCSSPVIYAALSEGVHVFSVNATDSLGNVGKTPATFRWTVDATAPVSFFMEVSPAAEVSNITTKSFTFGADETAVFECALDTGAFFSCQSPLDLNNLSEGPHMFQVRAKDSAGNQGLASSYSWVVDLTAPVISLGAVSPAAGLTNAKNISVEFSVNETAALYCRFDGAATAETCASPFTAQDLLEGNHSLEIFAVDTAGNVSTTTQLDWSMDFTAPILSFGQILPSAATHLNATHVEISVNAPEGVRIYASINGAAAALATSPIILDALAEGAYTVAVYGVDEAGNASEPLVHQFTVDLTAPVVALVPEIRTSPTSADHNSFELSANEAVTFECNLDSAGFAACTSPKDLSGLADGIHSLQVRAVDLAGNISSPASYVWEVDTHAPTTSVAGAANQTGVSLSFASDDPSARFLCSLDGADLAPCTSPVSYTGLSLGTHSFLVKAVDAAGNVDPAGAVFQFALSVPIHTSITGASPSAALTNQTSMSLSFVADQPNATYRCSLDGGAPVVCSSPMVYNNLSNGSHVFVVKAVDVFGNPDATGASYSWTVDTVAPVVNNPTFVVTTNSITVSWITNEPATDQLQYGVGSIISQATVESTVFATSHSIKITGLSSNTTYIIDMWGHDAAGNLYKSGTRFVKTSR